MLLDRPKKSAVSHLCGCQRRRRRKTQLQFGGKRQVRYFYCGVSKKGLGLIKNCPHVNTVDNKTTNEWTLFSRRAEKSKSLLVRRSGMKTTAEVWSPNRLPLFLSIVLFRVFPSLIVAKLVARLFRFNISPVPPLLRQFKDV